MTEWQPIETAPKDGTRIFGYGRLAGEISGEGRDNTYAVIRYLDGRTDYLGFIWYVYGTDCYAVWMNPTHWMSLPEPP